MIYFSSILFCSMFRAFSLRSLLYLSAHLFNIVLSNLFLHLFLPSPRHLLSSVNFSSSLFFWWQATYILALRIQSLPLVQRKAKEYVHRECGQEKITKGAPQPQGQFGNWNIQKYLILCWNVVQVILTIYLFLLIQQWNKTRGENTLLKKWCVFILSCMSAKS